MESENSESLFNRAGKFTGTWSAVHEAAAHSNLAAMEMLLRDDPRNRDLLHVRTAGKKTPLMLALENPETTPEMIKLLLAAGSDVNEYTADQPPLWYAIEVGNFEIVRLLVAHGACPNNGFHDYGDTALHYAANNCNLQLLKYFLDKCDCTTVNSYDETALHCACISDFTAGVEFLLKNAAHDTVIDMEASSGFGYLRYEQDTLEKKSKKRMMNEDALQHYSPLVVAVMQGNTRMVELLLGAGAMVTVDAVQYCFMSVGNVNVLKLLVDASFDTVYDALSYEGCEMEDEDQLEYMMQVMHSHVDCDILERTILDRHDSVLDSIICEMEESVFDNLSMFFEHNFTYEAADLFRKVQKYPEDKVGGDFWTTLRAFGIRGCWKEPVLDLKRLSAMAARSHIRHYTGSNWMARLMVQESALPTICKQQLFLQFAPAPRSY